MKKKILSETKNKVHFIFHLSDIHIRLCQRHDEYKLIFSKVYDILKNTPTGNHLIVITGDIFHVKSELSPECEVICFEFFKTLESFYPLLILPGNHDALLNNRDRLDNISPILYERNLKNTFYLKETGIYQFDNIQFFIDSLLDDIHLNMECIEPSSDFINIALYHGQIKGWQNLSGYISDT